MYPALHIEATSALSGYIYLGISYLILLFISLLVALIGSLCCTTTFCFSKEHRSLLDNKKSQRVKFCGKKN